jgi:hypothetical protein
VRKELHYDQNFQKNVKQKMIVPIFPQLHQKAKELFQSQVNFQALWTLYLEQQCFLAKLVTVALFFTGKTCCIFH